MPVPHIMAPPLQAERNREQLRWLYGHIFSFPTLLAAFLIAKVYWTCRDQIADPDIWWHLKNAEYLATHFRFPSIDTYSFTAAGSPWLNHEWLSELFYYGAFRAFGLQGIFVVFASALAVLMVTVFSLCRKQSGDPLAAALATFLGGLLAMVGFTPRTQHFGWLCLMAIYAILLRFRTTKSAPLWLIPVVFCVWVNCHGSWPFGLILFAIFVGAGLIHRDAGRLVAAPWSSRELKQLIVTGLASIACLMINPFGYHMLLYPFDTAFRQNLGVGAVQEWGAVDFNDPRGLLVAIVLGAVFAMALIVPKRWRIDDAILTAFVLYCGIAHIRFLLLAGIVLPPILAPFFGRMSSYRPDREHQVQNAVLLAIMAGVCVLGFPTTRMLEGEVAGFFPVRAVEFLRRHPQQGHMFNLYQWGGYLEWTLPQTQTFIDSRSDVFEHKGVLKDYFEIAGLSNSQETLDGYGVSYLLYPPDSPLSYFLSKSPQWERIYADEQALIYRRVGRSAGQ